MSRIARILLAGALIGSAPASAQTLLNLTDTSAISESNPGFSPNGRWLAYQEREAGGERFVVMDVATWSFVAERENVTETTTWSWDPTSTQIAFQQKPPGQPSTIHVWDVFTDRQASFLVAGSGPAWGSDGLIYYQSGSCFSGGISAIAPGSAPVQVVGPGSGLGNHRLSPDGRYLGYTQEVGCAGAQAFTVYVKDLVTGTTRSLGSYAEGFQRSLAFDPSSARMYWSFGKPTICSGSVVNGTVDCPTLARASQFAGPFQFPVGDTNQVFAPDGGAMAVFTGPVDLAGPPDTTHDIELLNLQTLTLTPIVDHLYDATAPIWSPDGNVVVFVGREAQANLEDLFVYRLAP